jgi:DNA-binding response OmpR family regulator
VSDTSALTAQLIVCERTGDWASTLRRALGERSGDVRECRTLTDAEQMLDRWSASLVAVEVTPAGFSAVLSWLADLQFRWPLARAVVLVSRELDEEARWALREAGAIHVALSPRELHSVASIAVRHLTLAPTRAATAREQTFGSLPWAADLK